MKRTKVIASITLGVLSLISVGLVTIDIYESHFKKEEAVKLRVHQTSTPMVIEMNNLEVFGMESKKHLKEKEIEFPYFKNEREKEKELQLKLKEQEKKSETVSRGGISRGQFKITAYDLSVESCGKSPSHPAYGVTASGYSLKNMSREEAMTIAVDTKVIPMGSEVLIEFEDEDWSHLDGVYTARDRGGAIKGNKIDLFMGSGDVKEEVKQFGRREAKVTILKTETGE